MRLTSKTALVAIVAAALATASARSDEPQPVSGKFEGKEWNFKLSDAYAFPGKVGLNDEPGVLVAVSNGGFYEERLDMMWDRKHVIDTLISDEDTLVVYFHFARNGQYKGLSYFFGSGDSCGLCFDGKTASTVKIAKGRIGGSLKIAKQPDEVHFDLKFDLPVASTDYGKPLAADFGPFGKVYEKFHAALVDGNPAALAEVVIAADAKNLADDGPGLVAKMCEDHPIKSYKILKGFERDDHGLLLIEGENGTVPVKTEVHFDKEEGSWRIYTEIMQVRFGEP